MRSNIWVATCRPITDHTYMTHNGRNSMSAYEQDARGFIERVATGRNEHLDVVSAGTTPGDNAEDAVVVVTTRDRSRALRYRVWEVVYVGNGEGVFACVADGEKWEDAAYDEFAYNAEIVVASVVSE